MKKIIIKLSILISLFVSSVHAATIYYQETDPISYGNFPDRQYITLPSSVPAGAYFYLEGTFSTFSFPYIYGYTSTPDPTNIITNNVEQLTLQPLGGGSYRTFGTSSAIYNYFRIWPIFDGLVTCILVSDSNSATCLPPGPTANDTLTSMQPNASAMKNAFNSQYATLANGLNNDCTIFDTNNVCVSVFGRNTSLNDSSFDNNAAGLILGYKPHAQFRIGTYIDQSLNSNTTAGVKVERSNPDFGVFGVWNMNGDGSGLELRAAANYGKRDLNVTRSVVADSSAEAGSGKSDLNAYGALLEASYAYAMNDTWTAKPYAGVRYLSIKRDSYTESMTDAVQNPLSYSSLKQETTSAIVGARLNGKLAPKLMVSLNAGLEHDLHHSIDDYRATATNIADIGTIDMNSQKDRTRPTAGLGISYDVADKQRLSASVQYRKEVFMSESSTTGQVNYTIGF